MSSPDEPETPEHEKSAMRLHGRLAEHGSTISFLHGEDYVKDVTEDRTTNARARSNADRAVAESKATEGIGTTPMEVAEGSISSMEGADLNRGTKAGVSEETQRSARGGKASASSAQRISSVGNSLSRLAHEKSMYEFNKDHQRTMDQTDTVGAMAGIGVAEYQDSQERRTEQDEALGDDLFYTDGRGGY